VLNGHGGNIAALETIITELTIDLRLPLAGGTYWQIAADSIRKILEHQGQVLHACEAETSMLQALSPETVMPLDASLTNRVRGEGAGSDGQIIGARWSQGRWPGKGALEFRGRGQRVLLRLPGKHASLTLLAWVRVDALPQPVTALLMTEEPQLWEPDGEKKAPASASFDLASGRPLRWELKANGQIGFNVLRGIVSGKPQWDAHLAPPLLKPELYGQWLCLATVHDAERGELTHFVNGVSVARHKLLPGPPLALTHLSLGNLSVTDAEARLGVNYGYFGAVDELLVAVRPFSAGELRRYYEVGRP
jgi:hypothetical protein